MKCKSKKAFFAVFLFLLTSCSNFLYVQQQKVHRQSLASTYVDTPDPLQKCPPKGQRLVIAWDCSKYKQQKQLYLEGVVIFCDLSEKRFSAPVCSVRSTEDFYFPFCTKKKNPILSYKISLVTEEGQVLDTWTHKLWVKPILIEE